MQAENKFSKGHCGTTVKLKLLTLSVQPQPGTGRPGNWHPRNFCKHDGVHVLHKKRCLSRLRYFYANFEIPFF